MSPTPQPEPARITDEGIAYMRQYIGVKRAVRPWNAETTGDTIWHFAQGMGDDNPLWWDQAYAAASHWGRMCAPPAYLYSCFSGGKLPDDRVPSGADGFLPGTAAMQSGDRWRWHRPLFAGEKIRAFQELHEVEVLADAKFGGPAVNQVERTTILGADDQLIAEMFLTRLRLERKKAPTAATPAAAPAKAARPLAQYSADERAAFSTQYASEAANRRGATPRYAQDVKVSDTLGRLLKGPLTVTNIIGWLMAWGSPLCQTNRILDRYIRANPGAAVLHAGSGIEDSIEAGHWDPAIAASSGFAAPYDFGCQRVAWMTHLLTDWMGDLGFLSELDVRVRRPNLLGDITWVSGTVTAVDGALVDCSVETRNQLNEVTATGMARVRLPMRTA